MLALPLSLQECLIDINNAEKNQSHTCILVFCTARLLKQRQEGSIKFALQKEGHAALPAKELRGLDEERLQKRNIVHQMRHD